MKITENNIEKLKDGYIGTMLTKIWGAPNVLDNCKKIGNTISVKARQDQGPTIHTIDEFCKLFKNKTLIML